MCVPLCICVSSAFSLARSYSLLVWWGLFFFYFNLFVFIFSYFINMLNACLFSDERARKTMDLGDRANLRGVGGEEMVIRIYCMKNNILSIKKRKRCRKIKVKFNVSSLWSSNSF